MRWVTQNTHITHTHTHTHTHKSEIDPKRLCHMTARDLFWFTTQNNGNSNKQDRTSTGRVTYWPSTQPSIKDQVHPVQDIKILPWPWTGWIWCKCDAHMKQVGIKQLYNPVLLRVRVSWSQFQLKFELQFEAVRTSSQQKAGPSGPRLSSPAKWEKKCCYSQRNWGVNMLLSVQCPTHLSHTTVSQPFRIKCERYIFLKKYVRSSLLLIIFPHVYVYSCICITAMQQMLPGPRFFPKWKKMHLCTLAPRTMKCW